MFRINAAIAILFAFSSSAFADTTCDLLAKNVPQDVLIEGSALQQFQYQKRLVCSSDNEAWGSANSKTLNGSLSIPGFVDAILGTSSNEQNWGQNLKSFCSLDEQQAAMNSHSSLEIRHASAVAYQAVVDCVKEYAEQNGIFGLLDVSDRRDTFTIKVTHRSDGSSNWQVRNFSVTPRSQTTSCDNNVQQSSISKPLKIDTATFTISCQKDPRQSVLVTINTDAGTLPTFHIASIDDDIAALRARVDQVEANAIPKGTVGWFNLPACPPGWTDFGLARGRTVFGAGNSINKDARGVAISNWGVGQTGGEESHVLTVDEMPAHSHSAQGYTGSDADRNGRRDGLFGATNGSTGSAGGGKPHSIMPPFVALTPCIRN
jgi:hypothetical protein